jgi:hypothetical protein
MVAVTVLQVVTSCGQYNDGQNILITVIKDSPAGQIMAGGNYD